MECCIWLAQFGPIMVKYELNVFVIAVLSAMIFSLLTKELGNVFVQYVPERIPLIVSQVFLMLFFNLLKQDS